MTRRTTSTSATTSTLPKGITKADMTRPSFERDDVDRSLPYEDRSFDIWRLAGFGWVIPTLAIAKGGARTYAVALAEGNARRVERGAQIRCGMGPHVLEQHTVYLRKSRAAALQTFLDLRREGAIDANTTRTRISSRRAQGQVERARGNSYWRWDV